MTALNIPTIGAFRGWHIGPSDDITNCNIPTISAFRDWHIRPYYDRAKCLKQ